MNKLLFTVLLSVPILSFANTTTSSTSFSSTEREGLPAADGGIKVIPIKKINALNNRVSANAILTAQQQIKTKGFYEVDNPEARTIMNMRNIKPLPVGSYNPADTNVKSTITDVGLAFPFEGVPVDSKNVVGFAGAGLYDKGWTGVTEIFLDRELGTCQYTLNNLKLSHGSELVPQEVARKDVYGKITTIDIRGSLKFGYTYSIHWADDKFMNDLQCANTTFNKNNNDKLVALAKKIDNSVSIR